MLNFHLGGRKIFALLVTWEYPPRVVGDLAGYVESIASGLFHEGFDVHIVTFDDWRVGYEILDGIKVSRTTNPVRHHISMLTWVLTLNTEFVRVISNIFYTSKQQPNLLHAFDWLTIPAAITIKHALGTPFVLTLHTIEDHRSHYAVSPYSLALKNIERCGALEAERVVADSDRMRSEIARIYGLDSQKIEVVPQTPDRIGKIKDIYTTVSKHA